ncbi:MAG: type II secretion system major pseudopilin GspG [Phycisphaerales bacterium]
MKSSRVRSRSGRRAFSLLELVLVMVIIGLLAAVAAFNLVGQANRARVDTTKQSIKVIEQALKTYNFDNGAFPATAQGIPALVPKYLEKMPLDGWKRPFNYYSPGPGGQEYVIISAGKDGIPDNEDDVRSWEIE